MWGAGYWGAFWWGGVLDLPVPIEVGLPLDADLVAVTPVYAVSCTLMPVFNVTRTLNPVYSLISQVLGSLQAKPKAVVDLEVGSELIVAD